MFVDFGGYFSIGSDTVYYSRCERFFFRCDFGRCMDKFCMFKFRFGLVGCFFRKVEVEGFGEGVGVL